MKKIFICLFALASSSMTGMMDAPMHPADIQTREKKLNGKNVSEVFEEAITTMRSHPRASEHEELLTDPYAIWYVMTRREGVNAKNPFETLFDAPYHTSTRQTLTNEAETNRETLKDTIDTIGTIDHLLSLERDATEDESEHQEALATAGAAAGAGAGSSIDSAPTEAESMTKSKLKRSKRKRTAAAKTAAMTEEEIEEIYKEVVNRLTAQKLAAEIFEAKEATKIQTAFRKYQARKSSSNSNSAYKIRDKKRLKAIKKETIEKNLSNALFDLFNEDGTVEREQQLHEKRLQQAKAKAAEAKAAEAKAAQALARKQKFQRAGLATGALAGIGVTDLLATQVLKDLEAFSALNGKVTKNLTRKQLRTLNRRLAKQMLWALGALSSAGLSTVAAYKAQGKGGLAGAGRTAALLATLTALEQAAKFGGRKALEARARRNAALEEASEQPQMIPAKAGA